ncbi:MAG: methyltransferase domain-containing protein [Selenomonadaceae bacterium]|nr:methyltransferase domain-containing protein [Selenomonadaceae bacterium]
MSDFNRDSNYWNQYYSEHKHYPPSLFAQSLESKLQPNMKLLELGCGNGRDSIFFDKLGVNVTAIDASQTAIDMLRREHPNINFICGDFVDLPVTILGGGDNLTIATLDSQFTQLMNLKNKFC